ncbi:MAG TPA: ribosome biogenesis/translation initiation ATPase RLI [Candidatus Aenigmarchaeota archaeon]|nr:ribosome biogenesis/translation initiation ATPase RLI [Candidatus Aenigmarchaeota archaeon]
MRLAIIDENLCEPKKCSNLCAKVCPRNKLREKCIIIEEKAKINENLCVGCGICVNRCPFRAIKIINTPREIGILVHRYGENKFALYNLPIPEKSNIIGLLGRNGIGKSTAINILANEITIDFEKLPTISKVYLKKIRKISYKPQILKEVEIEEINRQLIKEFNIEKKSSYSGGELQKLNIALCLSKEADLYLLDEPSSYLDISERLKVANIIKEKLEDKEVIIVEHDLAMLDYLSDKIYILYGSPGAYGVVSSLYSSLRGINSYLEGYLPAENVRLRREKIRFEIKSSFEKLISKEVLVSFTDIEKKLGKFKLKVKSGIIYKNEILGVLGPNSIGKTTFMEILAHKIKPDFGKTERVKISYKPQYLRADTNKLVKEVVPKTREFKEQISYPLNLDILYEKNIMDLSGGELQTLAIALCLSKEADLYLLDEPSAFLDIENRLQLTKILRRIVENKNASIVTIDHDLHLLAQISDRILFFSGIPRLRGKGEIINTHSAINNFLKGFKITFRKDKETGRFKTNKPGSQLDKEQKKSGEYIRI